jgi:Protein of unknown function/AsmA-like C-terminal region
MPGRKRDTRCFAAPGQDEPPAGSDTPRAHRRSAAVRMRRGMKRLLIWLGSLFAALILVIGFGFWRLIQGPIELDRLTPYFEEALNRSADGLHLGISGVRFAIERNTRQLDLHIEGVRLSRADGEAVAAFSEMSASFSLSSLLRGRLAPTRFVLEHPTLRFSRDRDGKIGFRFGDQDADLPNFGLEILDQAAGPPEPGSLLGSLRRVAVRDATLILDDERTGLRWQVERVNATLERNPEGLAGDLSMAIAVGALTPELHASYRYASAGRTLDLALEVGALEPATLAADIPDLAPLTAIGFPVFGTLETRIDLAGLTVEGVRVDLGFGAGSLKSNLLPEGTLALRGGQLHAAYAAESSQLRLTKFELDLGGGSMLTVKGSLDGVAPGLMTGTDPAPSHIPGTLGIALTDVPVARLENLWPLALSSGGRRWVLANVHDGTLDEAGVQLDVAVDPAARSAEIVSAQGAMRYHDLTINYFGGLPPVRKVSGTAMLADKRLTFTPNSGRIKSIQVTGGTLDITDLGAPVEWQTIDLNLSGPLREVLEVVDSKPLRYAHEVGLDPAQVAGRTAFNLHFKLPLLRNLKFEDVEYGVKASLTDAAISKVAMDRDLGDGNFALEIGRTGLRLQGSAKFDGIPMSIDGGIAFRAKDGVRARYRIALTLDDEQRRRLGCDYLSDRLTGPVGVDLTYSGFDAGRAEAASRLDLQAASLSFPEAGWSKPRDVPGTGRLVVDLANEQIARLREVEVKAAGLSGKFALALTPDKEGIERVDIERLVVGDNDVAGTVARRSEGGWRVDLHGPRLDLTQWVKEAGKETPHVKRPPLVIDARLGRLILGPRREVRDLSAHLLREDDEWQVARIDAHFVNGRQLYLRADGSTGKQALSFQSDDLGSTLSLLDVTDNIVGGRVAIDGQVSEASGKRVVHGHVEGEDYSLVRAPGFARVLSLASLSGVGSMLTGSGIPFTTLRGDFDYSNNHLVLDNLLAYGGAIGLTANGVVHLGRDRLDLQGTIVPAYTLNSIIGNIPVIGSLLLGGEGQGLFAANYRATGSAGDPQLSVNPLSALTPGFLRRLFQPNFGIPRPIEESLGTQ